MAIKWDRFTVKSQEAVQAAAGFASENGNPEVLPLHLMAALLEDREGVVIPVLEKVGVPVEQMLSGVNSAIAEAAEGAGRRPAGDVGRDDEGTGAGVQGGGKLQGRVLLDGASAAGACGGEERDGDGQRCRRLGRRMRRF